jgi:hypothetical protein
VSKANPLGAKIHLTLRCRSGFIPIYERGADGARKLNNCHDPVIVTSTVGGRCLIPEHCDQLVKPYKS